MKVFDKFYIDGKWVSPSSEESITLVNPATEEAEIRAALGNEQDVDRAVAAAKAAFVTWSNSTVAERLGYIEKIAVEMESRREALAQAQSIGMGMPISAARTSGADAPISMTRGFAEALKQYEFEERQGSTCTIKQPIGVCGLITPWNWPLGQIVQKVIPAIATGCTMVLKPSEMTPADAVVFAEAVDAAGLPAGVFNLVLGRGPTVGARLASHPDVPMLSITSSTRAGEEVIRAGAPYIKRVAAELGGKSANVLLDDADFQKAVSDGVRNAFRNCGQSCSAPTRMLVPTNRYEQVKEIARSTALSIKLGLPADETTEMGPIAFVGQYEKVQEHIRRAIEDGAELIVGGPGKPEGAPSSLYCRPTIFGVTDPELSIAKDEVFGPVLCIIPYADEVEALAIANDTEYGLGGYVQASDLKRAREFALKMVCGTVNINGSLLDWNAPFGGVKKSGIGRERGAAGFDEYLEIKSIIGFGTDD